MAKTTKVKNHPGIYSYDTLSGKRYAVSTTVGGKQRWAQGFKTIAEAEEAKATLRTRGNAPASLTLEQYLREKWLPSLNLPKSARAYQGDVDRITRHIGAVKLSRLEPLDVETMKEGLRRDGLSAQTCAHAYTRLSQALRQARRWRLIRHNPCEDVDPPKKDRYHPPIVDLPTAEILERLAVLFAASEKHGHGLMVYLKTITGMRSQEVFGLEWSHVDFATGWLRIPRENTKSAAGAREVLLDAALLERLQAHKMGQMRKFQISKRWVFTNRDGKPHQQSSFWFTWKKIREDAGMPDMHFHDLRHIQGTLLARLDVHPSVAQQRLGHSDVSTTLGIYTHVNREGQAAAVEGLAKLFGGTG